MQADMLLTPADFDAAEAFMDALDEKIAACQTLTDHIAAVCKGEQIATDGWRIAA